MKKKLFSLMAMAIALASCQNENLPEGVDQNGEFLMSVSANVPELVNATRAVTDATKTNSALGGLTNVDWEFYDLRYILEVYAVTTEKDADGNDVEKLTLAKERQYKVLDNVANGSDWSFQVRLTHGRNYKFVFWADFVKQGATDANAPDLFYNTNADGNGLLADVTFNDVFNRSNVTEAGKYIYLNNEARDAYFNVTDVEAKAGMTDAQITLKRPFGKVRLVTTDAHQLDLGRYAKTIQIDYYSQENVLANRPNGINLITGEPCTNRLEHSYTTTIGEEDKTVTNVYTVTLPVAKFYKAGLDATKGTQTLFVDYIIGEEGDQNPIHFSMTAYDDQNEIIYNYNFATDIPVQRNYLTTLIGDIFTTPWNITVKVQDAFDKELISDEREWDNSSKDQTTWTEQDPK